MILLACFGLSPAARADADVMPGSIPAFSPSDFEEAEMQWITSTVFEGTGSNSTPHFSVHSDSWRIKWSVISQDNNLSTFGFFVKQISPFSYPVASMLDDKFYQDKTIYLTNVGQEYYIKVFAANVNEWNIAVQEQTGVNISPVQISHIKYLGTEKKSYIPQDAVETNELSNGSGFVDFGETGTVCRYKNEPDEYVLISNTSNAWIDISGWTLRNTADAFPVFTFPQYLSTCPPYFNTYLDCGYNCIPPAPCKLGPYQSFRVYTDEINPASGGFSFNYGPGNMWDNEKADTAVLCDSAGNEISRRSYTIIAEPAADSPIQISRINYKGTISYNQQDGPSGSLSEANEYVVIKNISGCFQDISGWKLANESRDFPVFIFPHGFYLCPFETIRIYTNEIHPEWDGLCSTYNAGKLLFDYYDDVHDDDNEKCSFFPFNTIHQGSHLSFNYSRGNIWSNDKADSAVLYNSQGVLMDRRSYTVLHDSGTYINQK